MREREAGEWFQSIRSDDSDAPLVRPRLEGPRSCMDHPPLLHCNSHALTPPIMCVIGEGTGWVDLRQ